MINEQSRKLVAEVFAEAEQYIAPDEVGLVGQAGSVVLPMVAHRMANQGRLNERLLQHTLAAALHLAELRFDREYVAAMLLAYPLATGDLTLNEVGTQLGELVYIVAELMRDVADRFEDRLPWRPVPAVAAVAVPRPEDGAKKWYWRVHTQNREPTAFLAIAQVPEVAIAKIVDRLHLLIAIQDLDLDPDLAVSIAQQSLDVHATVAEMLGVWSVKSRLEDEAFKIVDRAGYDTIVNDLDERLDERKSRIQRAIDELHGVLDEAGIQAEITGRPKHLYSIFQKVRHMGLSVREVNDSLGVRVIVEAADDDPVGCQQCYELLSLLFNRWPMTEGIYEITEGKPYRDWIERPKSNGYQSIHTTLHFEGRPLEVQIRSRKMHDLAEYGAAAHWVYKQDGSSSLSQAQYDKFLERVARVRRAYEDRQKRLETQLGGVRRN